jgi:hypothetical protein
MYDTFTKPPASKINRVDARTMRALSRLRIEERRLARPMVMLVVGLLWPRSRRQGLFSRIKSR